MSSSCRRILKARAEEIVQAVIAELPPEVAVEAGKVSILYETESGTDREILGTYENFIHGEIGEANGPIVLYLGAIDDYCTEEDRDFETEVRLTYLHELGHHLGWNEDDLEARGLN